MKDAKKLTNSNISLDPLSEEDLELFFLNYITKKYDIIWKELDLKKKRELFTSHIKYYEFILDISKNEILYFKKYYPAIIFLILLKGMKDESKYIKEMDIKNYG